MKQVNATEVKKIFNLLNKKNLNYILMRNINNELPAGLDVGKDIDILISKSDEKEFINFFHNNDYQTIDHPFKYGVFLYGVDKFEFKYNNKNNILFDLSFQIAVRSLDAGQWIPLDQTIQESAWKNKRFEQLGDDFGYWTLSYEDEIVCLVSRAIFDKKEFQKGYIKRINKLIKLIDIDSTIAKFNTVFFKFTPNLITYIKNQKYDEIIKNHLQFKEY